MLRLSARLILGLFLAGGAALSFCSFGFAEEIKNQDCLDCHSDFSQDHFSKAVHGPLLCTACHKGITELDHAESLPKVDCGSCHRTEAQIYLASDHGKARQAGVPAAICGDCHGDPHVFPDTRNPASPVARHNIAKTCASCHEDQKKMAQSDLLEKTPYKSYMETVHGKAVEKGVLNAATCTDCHGSHDLHAPANSDSKINRANIPETCGKCHENVLQTYRHSVHGKSALSGKVEAPVCTDCHGEHTILSHWDPKSKTYATAVSEKVCSSCHEAERIITKFRLPSDRLKSFKDSFHGLAGSYGVTTVANCSSCHGAHDVLPASDPSSSVHKKNLPQTCGKCHPDVGEQLAKGSVHLAPSPVRDRAVYAVTVFYWILIFCVIGGMLFHNVLDFMAKFRVFYKRRLEFVHVRFSFSERIQHWILVFSFIVLAYTGFALKFPDEWWALPITVNSSKVDWRALIHRASAILFSLVCVYHAFYLVFTRRGRKQVSALKPSGKDFSDLIQNFSYYFGRSKQRAHFERYGYVEKAEYWALVWGAFIMIVTGTVLVYSDWSLKVFPKWVLDVATAVHFYEAVLATLAIVVWHFYFTIFDPEHYPMNMSMLSGKSEHPSGEDPEPPDAGPKKEDQ